MTNLLVTVVITLSTNWTTVGYYYPKEGPTYQEVQEGRLMTNAIACFFWKDKGHEVILEQTQGPVVAERKLPMPIKTFSNSPTNWFVPNVHVYMTNRLLNP